MPTSCPHCKHPLTEDGRLRYCDGCAYEPPESAMLPVTLPGDEVPDDIQLRPAPKARGQASTRKE